MGTSKLPDRIPIPGAIKFQEKVFTFGGLSGLVAVGAFAASNGLAGVIAGGIAACLFWLGSKIKTHRVQVAEGKVYE